MSQQRYSCRIFSIGSLKINYLYVKLDNSSHEAIQGHEFSIPAVSAVSISLA
jgi:hypothetical protein